MKTAPLVLLLGVLLAQSSSASGPPAIFITTSEKGISYRLVDHNQRSETLATNFEDVGAWSSERVKAYAGEVVFIYPDGRTSFKTVLDLLRRLKTAGVKVFAAGDAETEERSELFQFFPSND